MGRYPTEEVHISKIRVGDTVIHDGKEMTVCGNNLTQSDFMGLLLFGDCYRLGTQRVIRCIMNKGAR